MKSQFLNQAELPLLQFKSIEHLFFGCLEQNPKIQRELFDRLAAHLTVLASEVEGAMLEPQEGITS